MVHLSLFNFVYIQTAYRISNALVWLVFLHISEAFEVYLFVSNKTCYPTYKIALIDSELGVYGT